MEEIPPWFPVGRQDQGQVQCNANKEYLGLVMGTFYSKKQFAGAVGKSILGPKP